MAWPARRSAKWPPPAELAPRPHAMVAGQVAGPARRYHQRLLADAYATCGQRTEPCYRAALAFVDAEALARVGRDEAADGAKRGGAAR